MSLLPRVLLLFLPPLLPVSRLVSQDEDAYVVRMAAPRPTESTTVAAAVRRPGARRRGLGLRLLRHRRHVRLLPGRGRAGVRVGPDSPRCAPGAERRGIDHLGVPFRTQCLMDIFLLGRGSRRTWRRAGRRAAAVRVHRRESGAAYRGCYDHDRRCLVHVGATLAVRWTPFKSRPHHGAWGRAAVGTRVAPSVVDTVRDTERHGRRCVETARQHVTHAQ